MVLIIQFGDNVKSGMFQKKFEGELSLSISTFVLTEWAKLIQNIKLSSLTMLHMSKCW